MAYLCFLTRTLASFRPSVVDIVLERRTVGLRWRRRSHRGTTKMRMQFAQGLMQGCMHLEDQDRIDKKGTGEEVLEGKNLK